MLEIQTPDTIVLEDKCKFDALISIGTPQYGTYPIRIEFGNMNHDNFKKAAELSLLGKALITPDGQLMLIKQQIDRVRNMKIEMYSNDHNPPHFHVKSQCGAIDAVFKLDDCCFIQGTIDSKDRRRIVKHIT